MASVIKLKRGTATPTTSDIVSGEVAIDTSAQQIYINDSGTVKRLGQTSLSDLSITSTSTELNLLDGVTGITLGSANELLVVGGDGSSIVSDSTLAVDTGNNRLGINQSSPEVTLHMTGEGAQTAQIRMEQYNDSADAPDLRTRRYRGTIASPSAISSGDYLYRSNHEYWNGSALIVGGTFAFDNTNDANRTQFAVSVTTDGTSADANTPSKVQFKIDGNDSGAITFNNAYKFPTSDGSANQVLQTDGSGALSFATITESDISDLGSYITASSTDTLTNKTIDGSNNTISNIGNSSLTNSSITINGSSVALGGSTTISTASTLTIADDTSTTASIDLNSETLTVAGGTGITTSVSGNTLTITGSATQNTFSTINLNDSTNIVADSTSDTLNLDSSGLISITGDASTDTVTVSTVTSATVPFLKADGSSSDIDLQTQGSLSDVITNLYIPFTIADGSAQTSLVVGSS